MRSTKIKGIDNNRQKADYEKIENPQLIALT